MLASVAIRTSVVNFCLFTLFYNASIASAADQGGVIHFTGQVVESPCDINRVKQGLAMSCDREGKNQTRYWSPQALVDNPGRYKDIATVNMRYIDKQKKLAVVSVTYR